MSAQQDVVVGSNPPQINDQAKEPSTNKTNGSGYPYIEGLDDLQPDVEYDNLPKRWNLPSFSGSKNESLDVWESDCRKLFEYCQIVKSRWVHLASKKLRGPASEWWSKNETNLANASWSKFIKAIKTSDFYTQQHKSLVQRLEEHPFNGDYEAWNEHFKRYADPSGLKFEHLMRLYLKPLPAEHRQFFLVDRPHCMWSLYSSSYRIPKLTKSKSNHKEVTAKPASTAESSNEAKPSAVSSTAQTAAAAPGFCFSTSSSSGRLFGPSSTQQRQPGGYSGGFSFGTPSSTQQQQQPQQPQPTGGFSFGSPSSTQQHQQPQSTGGLSFGPPSSTQQQQQQPQATGGFSFGSPSSTQQQRQEHQPFAAFSFGTSSSTSEQQPPSSGGLTFGSSLSTAGQNQSSGFSFGPSS